MIIPQNLKASEPMTLDRTRALLGIHERTSRWSSLASSQFQALKGSDTITGNRDFGGILAAVAMRHAPASPVYLYTRTAAGWKRVAELTGVPNPVVFGASAAISGTAAVVGLERGGCGFGRCLRVREDSGSMEARCRTAAFTLLRRLGRRLEYDPSRGYVV